MSSSEEGFNATNFLLANVKLPPWWLVLIEGILLVIIGIWLFLQPVGSMLAVVFVLGIYWLISGILNLVRLIWDRSMWGWKIFAGILAIIAGWIVLQNPIGSTAVVSQVSVWMLAFAGIFIGISSLIQAFKGGGWGIGILGVISIVLGILLLLGNFAAIPFMAYFLGFFALVGGIGAIINSFRLRSLQKDADAAREARGID